MRHLRPEQVVGFRDGTSEDPRVAEHLATCTPCQLALGESRWSLTLRSSEAGRGERAHPSQDELAAFGDNALATPSAQSLERHLRSCDRCLALYSRLRAADAQVGFPSPPQDLLRATRQSFQPRPPIHLGSLLLQQLGDVLALTYRPELGGRGYGSGGYALASSRPRPRMDLTRTRATAFGLAERSQKFGGYAEDASSLLPSGSPSSRSVEIEAADLRILLEVVEQDDEISLSLALHRTDSSEPARGVSVRLRSEGGSPVEIQTDEDGRGRVLFPSGPSRLEIRGETAISFDLENPR